MSIQISGLLGFIIFVLDIWAIIRVIQSPASTGTKVLWTVLILLMPVLGLVLWIFLGPRDRSWSR